MQDEAQLNEALKHDMARRVAEQKNQGIDPRLAERVEAQKARLAAAAVIATTGGDVVHAPATDEPPPASVPPGPEAVTLGTNAILQGIEIKQAFLARTVSLALIDVARSYLGLIMAQPSKQKGADGKPMMELPAPKDARATLEVVEKALALAGRADLLAERAVVLSSDTPATPTT